MSAFLIAVTILAAAWALTSITLALGWGLAAGNLNGDPEAMRRADERVQRALEEGR